MQKDTKKREGGGRSIRWNVVIPAAVVLLAAGLLAAELLLPGQTRTQEDINRQIAALTTPTPAPSAAPTKAADASTPAPSAEPAAASPTLAPAAEENKQAALAEAYLFIIRGNRIWGIEALGEERDVTVDQGDGVVNVIHLLPDGFYMASSTCENQLCVTEGTVTVENYQRRILGPCVYCLPHSLQLELVIPGATPDPNAPDI